MAATLYRCKRVKQHILAGCSSLCFRFRPWEMRPGQYIAATGPDGAPAFPQPDPQQEESIALPLR